MENPNGFQLPDNLRGRSIDVKVIPTVCNLENMLKKLSDVNGDFSQLKQWERRSYKPAHIIKAPIKEDFQPKIFPNPAKNKIAAKIPIQTTKTG